ncbi:hypothetical protein T492DRAFT_1087072 [Pavlovales sp. CCMP2436]|nr:hypothetical protein T492DRAFT_1087072 [Pavlovales sp. CCMP2436]|mmetsp:Transcript_43986/g.108900  ORF Transcript_43986/g.108900 Transcript_43986/m.108900 type:complete len:180 (+) Transcript_43986:72-611(+)
MLFILVLAAQSFAAGPLAARHAVSCSASQRVSMMAYIPDGFTKETWAKKQAADNAKKAGKNLGIIGVTTFNSRVLDARSADEARAMGEKKMYRFPDKTTGNKDNYVRAEGGREQYRASKEYEQMLARKEAELKRDRLASAKISGASGGVRSSNARKQAAAAAPKEGGMAGFFGSLFGKK